MWVDGWITNNNAPSHLLFAADKGASTKTEWALAHIVLHSICNAVPSTLLSSYEFECTILPAMAHKNLWFVCWIGDLCYVFLIDHNGRAVSFQKVIHGSLIAFPLCLKLGIALDFGLVGMGLVDESMPTLGTSRESAWIDTKATQLLEFTLPLLLQNLDRLCIPVFVVHLCELLMARLLNCIKELKIWLQIMLLCPSKFHQQEYYVENVPHINHVLNNFGFWCLCKNLLLGET